jgi:tRNA wybutosine-synthesizing protein 4
MFVDIDYKELMMKKREVVQNTAELNSMLTNILISPTRDVLLRSDEYIQLGCDLRDLTGLERMMSSVVNIKESLMLFTAEVSITYMDVKDADALIRWAGMLPDGEDMPHKVSPPTDVLLAHFCLLEQLLPDGIDHPFAHTMMAHFKKLQTPLRAVQKYPTIKDQRRRFENLGWSISSAYNLWELWSSSTFASTAERKQLDSIESFDEWEEFALFGCHYFLLVADTVDASATPWTLRSDTLEKEAIFSSSSEHDLQIEASYEAYPRAQGCNRFAAAIHIRGRTRTQDGIGVFGGMGMTTRVNSVDEYTTDEQGPLPFHSNGPLVVPSSRMCHTITDIGDVGALLIGGRTSPDNALTDCWFFHKYLNLWERLDDLPVRLYRHQAVHLGDAHILVSPGRIDSRTISSSWYIVRPTIS